MGSGAVRDVAVSSPSARSIRGASTFLGVFVNWSVSQVLEPSALEVDIGFFLRRASQSVQYFREGFVPLTPLSRLGLSLSLRILVLGGVVLGWFLIPGTDAYLWDPWV